MSTRMSRDERTALTREALEMAARTPEPLRQRWLDQAIELNMGFALSQSRAYRGRGEAADDLDQVAMLGLVKATQGFDPTRGDFLAYAAPTIRGEIKRYYRDLAWMVRPPRRIQDLQAEITRSVHDLEQSLGRSPLPREVAAALGRTEEQVVEALASSGCYRATSLEETTTDDSAGPGAWLKAGEPGFEQVEAVAMLRSACGDLTPRERTIIRMRFYEDRTQSEIAEELGVTQAQVSRLLTRIMSSLRDRLGEPALPLAV
jgi:RNA polymerase sigma-B factor